MNANCIASTFPPIPTSSLFLLFLINNFRVPIIHKFYFFPHFRVKFTIKECLIDYSGAIVVNFKHALVSWFAPA